MSIYAIVCQMEETGDTSLSREQMYEIEKVCFLPVVRRLPHCAIQVFGDHADAMQELWRWFLNGEDNTKREPFWPKAKRYSDNQPDRAREASVVGHIKNSAKHYLGRKASRWDWRAALTRRLDEALCDPQFENLGMAWRPESTTYSLNPKLDAEEFADRQPKRPVENRFKNSDLNRNLRTAVPDASRIRDALLHAMHEDMIALTRDQARMVAIKVFELRDRESPLDDQKTGKVLQAETEQDAEATARPADQDAPESGEQEVNETKEPTGDVADEGTQVDATPTTNVSAPVDDDDSVGWQKDVETAVEKVMSWLAERDGCSPDARPPDSKQGRNARYFLDFYLWVGWPLRRGGEFTLEKFEEATSLAPSSVDEWKRRNVPKRSQTSQSEKMTDLMRMLATRPGQRRPSIEFAGAVLWRLRDRFRWRMPEIVDPKGFDTIKNKTETRT